MTTRSLALVGLLLSATVVGVGPTLAAQSATVDDDSLPLASAERQVVTGETSVTPGSELTVRLRSTDSDAPFLRQQSARVAEDGSFAAVFDMSSTPPNTTYRLTVLYDGQTLTEREERIVACDGDCADPVPETPTPTPAPSGDAAVQVTQGDVAEIPVAMDGTETAVFSIGGDDVNYLVNASLTDGDGDGTVTVRFDTANAGTDGETLSTADADDSLTVTHEEPDLPSTLDPAAYEYRVFYGDGTGDGADAVGTLLVESDDAPDEQFDVDEAPEFGFERSVYRARQGETARLTVVLADAEAATVSIGGRESGYEINATVRDGDGDGTVTLLFDTAAAGHDGPTLGTAADADSVAVEPGSEVALDTRLDATDYDLTLYRGAGVSDDVADIGTLSVQAGEEFTSDRGPTATIVDGPTDRNDTQSLSGLPLGPGSIALGVGGLVAIAGLGIVLRPLL
ncbi:hypothetical protein EGH21_03065 [Halomicroarcula sp. F13]|uniref:DUF7827 domain-containing protein n=1 Tax=Haloarcula rubra TaxID=2487747 RepID=A0AAW4PMM3_9EURY|nr:BGTF surface domain-containing protein [Halomicroarcula rubra]MBX0322006.1 hypothetical protein [Halomicroarcula rubra]